MTHAEAIRDAHAAYRDAIGTDSEQAAYTRLAEVVRRDEIRHVLELTFTEDDLVWMVPSCPSVDHAKRAVANATQLRDGGVM